MILKVYDDCGSVTPEMVKASKDHARWMRDNAGRFGMRVNQLSVGPFCPDCGESLTEKGGDHVQADA